MSVIKDIEINNGSSTPITADLGGSATNIDYDGTTSGLISTNAQAAIDEVANKTVQFVGTQAQWNALTTEQKNAYNGKAVIITDDYGTVPGSGHTIVNKSGTEMEQRSKLKFATGTVTDDSTNDVTIISLGSAAEADIPSSGDASSTQVVLGNDSRLTDSRSASDVYEWAKASTKPTYTATEVGAIASTEKGAASGVAELDFNGKVPSSQLPSYVDDVIEGFLNPTDNKFYKNKSEDYQEVTPAGTENPHEEGWYEFDGLDYTLTADTTVDSGKTYYEKVDVYTTEITAETDKIYVDKQTNISYRWSGSMYIEIGSSLALGETSSTAYRGDHGKAAYDHSLVTSGNPHNVTKANVGLGNVGNFKAVSTEASQGLTDTEKANARTNIGAGTSSFSGSYNDLTDKPEHLGHTIEDENGVSFTQRSILKIIGAAIEDDSANDTTVVEIQGGSRIELGDVSGASASTSFTTASLTWTDPTDVTIEGITFAKWAGTLVVRKAGSAPSDRTDGTVVLDSKVRNAYSSSAFQDTGLSYDTTYYYRFFPYSKEKVYTEGSSVSVTPTKISITTVPSASALTYNGSSQSPTWSNYNSNQLTISGDTSGTNVGIYTAVFTPKDDYKWSDNSASKSVDWSISALELQNMSNSNSLTYNGTTQTATFSNSSAYVNITNNTATNAGHYRAFAVPNNTNVEWADETLITVTEYIDNTQTRQYTTDATESLSFDLSSVSDNNSHTGKIVATDGTNTDTFEFTFTKGGA